MIIKKWNPTGGPSSTGAWEAIYPKVTTAEIYTSNGATSIFNGNKIKIDYLPDAVFDSLYFQATLSGALSTAGAYADYWEPGIEHAITNRKSASAFKGYYYQISSAGTITDQGTATSGGVRGTLSQDKYFSWTFNNQDGGTGSGNSGYLEAGDWIVVENVSGGGTSATDPYFIEFSVVNNVYEIMTGADGTIAGAPGLVPQPAATDNVKFLRGDGTFATPTDTNTFRTVTIGGTSIGTSNALDISAGTNVTFGGTAANGDITINAAHPDISAADSSTNSGRTYIQSIGLDSNGHITSIATGTETVTDTTYTAGDGIGLTNEEFSVDGGVGITAITDGVKMTYPIAIDNSGTGPDENSGFRIAPSSTGGALWFDLS